KQHPDHDRPAQRLGLSWRQPLPRVKPHVAIPKRDEFGERDVLEARAAEVPCPRRWNDEDRVARFCQPPAVVDILEPRRRELLIERAYLGEHLAPQQQRRRGW